MGEREVDVLVVGAGMSGIGVARHLLVDRPGTSFAVLEARDAIGGTWDLFRYPGIRSDSDLHTFGYEFKPWNDRDSFASGSKILDYLHEAIAEHGIEQHVRLGHRVLSAEFDSASARWTVSVEVDGAVVEWRARWFFCASGYYRYDRGHSPEFAGMDDYRGHVVHPQFAAGYVQQAAAALPRQGTAVPWKVPTNYYEDLKTLRRGPLLDERPPS